jgi:hypothetical protein
MDAALGTIFGFQQMSLCRSLSLRRVAQRCSSVSLSNINSSHPQHLLEGLDAEWASIAHIAELPGHLATLTQ